jgi:hypothetical protein
MTTFLPKDVQRDLDAARIAAMKKTSRLRVRAGDQEFRVLRKWATGFSVEAGGVPPLRGLVDLFDGATHLAECLIIAAEEDAGEMRYEFKRSTEAHDKAPLDFYRDPDAPIALLGKDSTR